MQIFENKCTIQTRDCHHINFHILHERTVVTIDTCTAMWCTYATQKRTSKINSFVGC